VNDLEIPSLKDLVGSSVGYATIQDVMRIYRINSRTTVYRRINRGELPKPINPNGRPVLWRRSDLNAANQGSQTSAAS